MAYTKHTWVQRMGTKLNRFKDLVTSTYLELVNEPASVTQAGTPIRADWLNEMEEGIYQAHVTADAALPATGKAADSSKLDGMDPSNDATANTIPSRDASGRFLVQDPTDAAHPTSKNYVDSTFLLKSLCGTTVTGVAGSILSFALDNVAAGHTKFFYTSPSTTDLPTNGNFSYSSGFVLKRSATSITVVIFDYYNSGRIAVNGYSSGWKGWKIFESDVAFGSTVPSSLRPGQLFVKI